jgi:hypothetical protein
VKLRIVVVDFRDDFVAAIGFVMGDGLFDQRDRLFRRTFSTAPAGPIAPISKAARIALKNTFILVSSAFYWETVKLRFASSRPAVLEPQAMPYLDL